MQTKNKGYPLSTPTTPAFPNSSLRQLRYSFLRLSLHQSAWPKASLPLSSPLGLPVVPRPFSCPLPSGCPCWSTASHRPLSSSLPRAALCWSAALRPLRAIFLPWKWRDGWKQPAAGCIWVAILALPLTSYVSLSELFSLLCLHFLVCKMGVMKIILPVMRTELRYI